MIDVVIHIRFYRKRILWPLLCMVLVTACSTERKRIEPLPDFTLDDSMGQVNEVEESGYYSDLEKSTESIRFESSFPLGFAVGKSVSRFERTPSDAVPNSHSRVLIYIGDCRFFVRTGNIQVHRYLYTNQFIKIGEEIRASSNVKLDPSSDLNIKMSSQLVLELPKASQRKCWKVLYGRKTYIGRFHMSFARSWLIASPGSPKRKFKRYKNLAAKKGSQVFIHWNKNRKEPTIKNEMDFPATVESDYFRSVLSAWGFYHLGFQPVLRSSIKNSVTLRIPFRPPARKQKKKRR